MRAVQLNVLKPVVSAWLLFLIAMSVVSIFKIDFTLADFLYFLQGNTWAWKDTLITQDIIHKGGKWLSLAMGLATLFLLLLSTTITRFKDYRTPFLYLFSATLLSALLIATIKHLVSMECPWNLIRYGGERDFIGLLDIHPPSMPASACFPAGHASAGYTWIALYFFFAATRPQWRWAGLALGLGLGLTFGITQQLRGAHFLSHDLWTVMICWTVSFVLSRFLLLPRVH
ncbi:phosphatase PAP2 family protein [Vreelandella titanicae]|uniref:phosphatase PAP2 family protein n=1 Tax=Vreelandella titanicae TaxID=664683 RepID=UPI000889BC65|nr:phosphatase PAP2 family protein [Halomonas titanicae]UEQ04013.1 phosphatase PAP2 family protein [Halomonas profundus]SDI81393.1 Membrane-associated enzyme, PAP2 (acid phosphatase) superfamily [Halomonas titanicae]